ncbi:hypothetical protein BDV28DRAFT_151787 [Aspergillus coremiiformis]|uniref:Transmembrane protein n=1 Tax=Aspergillus coremiiformis TaxID=138285 RepID=A0A5N6YVP2_9EURO|nr:hypothetical protein BDV28DRAFT_151787 [Aspergillus coremiiformis]
MPTTRRPNTDDERWPQHHNLDAEFQRSPQYDPPHISYTRRYLPFQSPKTDKPRNPFTESQIRFSHTDKHIESSHRETSNTPIFVLLFIFIILVAIAYAHAQLAHSSPGRQSGRRSEKKEQSV